MRQFAIPGQGIGGQGIGGRSTGGQEMSAIQPPARRRGRPPKNLATINSAPKSPARPSFHPALAALIEVAEPAEPPAPRLLRKADVAVQHPLHSIPDSEILTPPKPPSDTLHGVVKWFDIRTHRGALRLTGVSGDVPLEGAVLDRCGIKRIYKDQEVEAKVLQTGGRIRVVSVGLPGRPAESDRTTAAAAADAALGMVRKHTKPVVVEIKRDAVKRTSARAQAEQVLGAVGRIKSTRRVTT
ncbi:MAG TPA: hypothetical protein VNT30_22915 [Stellaceae bacterium]|nr:hypothetical protein [Stellaceae bacterium]